MASPGVRPLGSIARLSPVRALTLVALLSTAPLVEGIRLSALSSVDVWWHLRSGLWILQQRALPHSGLFSQYSSLPWNDSSWAFDVVLAVAYKLLGLRAIVILAMALKLGLAWIGYRVAQAAGAGFWSAVVLSAGAQYVISGVQPTPGSLSILFFGVELVLLVESRRSGSLRPLFWLLPLFVLWANVHVQFVVGLALLGVFLMGLAAERGWRRADLAFLPERSAQLPLGKVGIVAGAACLGTLANPHSYHLFADVGRTLYSNVSFQYVAEMRAMSFRRPQDYLLMLLVMTAFLALGRRRSLEAFELMALVAATLLAFRIQRDAWPAVLVAVAVIGGGFSSIACEPKTGESKTDDPSRVQIRVAGVLVAFILVAAALRLPNSSALLDRVAQNFPVRACDFISRNHLPQPLFNTYGWGGFLTWYLPENPVSVDSRIDLYRDEVLARYFEGISGKSRLETDPAFAAAQTLLLERKSGMVKALTEIPALRSQYRLAYSDEVAAVFVRR